MNEKLILPITYPIVDHYPAPSSATAIMGTDSRLYPWILSHFIQLVSMNQSDIINLFDFSIEWCPFLIYNEIRRELIVKKWDKLSDFIIDAINTGYYVRVFVNPNKLDIYHGVIHHHDILIYGFDKNENVFYVGDHFDIGTFSYKKCSFDDLNNSYDFESQREIVHYIVERIQLIELDTTLYRYKFELYRDNTRIYDFDLEKFKRVLTDYVMSRPSLLDTSCSVFPEISSDEAQLHYWGISCYDAIQKSLSFSLDTRESHILQSLYVFYLHKTIMIKRLEYIRLNNIIDISQEVLNVMIKLQKQIRNINLSYIRSLTIHDTRRKKEMQIKISENLNLLRDIEEKVLNNLLRLI